MKRYIDHISKNLLPLAVGWLLPMVTLTVAPDKAAAQDLHFSQFMNNPLLLNPANTGFNPDYDYRIGATYRRQYWGLPVPYNTMSIWGDAQLLRDRGYNGWMGVGGAILRDVAGSGNLTSTKAFASVAWHQELGLTSLLSAGFNIGFAAKSVDLTKFRWENQWNGKFFDGNFPSGEQFAFSQVSYFDLQAGINYAWFPTDNIYLNAGASILHLNKPRESFFDKNISDNKVPQRYSTFINATIKLNDQWIINPNVYYSQQANSSEIVGGMMAQYNLSGAGEQQLLAGLYYRSNDAIIPMVGLQWSDIRATFSYDATTSALRNYNNGNGAIELSIIKSGIFNGSTPRQSRCPTF